MKIILLIDMLKRGCEIIKCRKIFEMLTASSFILVLISINPLYVCAQKQKRCYGDSTFSLSVHVTSGYTTELSSRESLEKSGGISTSFGLMWMPNHILNIGIESAFLKMKQKNLLNFSNQYGNTSFQSEMNAVPVLLVFNMRIWKFSINGGMGLSNITSKIEAFNQDVDVNNWYYTYYFSAGYEYLVKPFSIGIDAKLYSFSKLEKNMGGVMLKISWIFWKW